jgi:tetratricopeptide (TPR) repeat protein
MVAEAHARAGQPDAGLDAIREAFEIIDRTDERWWEADLHRLRGELTLVTSGSTQEAESCFHRAIEVARERRVPSLELRATTSLARLWRNQERTAEARQILGAIHGSFTEARHPRSRRLRRCWRSCSAGRGVLRRP